MQNIFECNLTLENPIVKGHQIFGRSVLPGLAYIDMLSQLAKEKLKIERDDHCFRNLAIYNPLVVSKENPVRLRITFENVQRYWKVSVESVENDATGQSKSMKLFVTAELHLDEVMPEELIDVETVKLASTKMYDLESIYSQASKIGLVHQGMMKAKGNIYVTSTGCLVDVNTETASNDIAANYMFHPVLLDGAAMSSMILIRESMPGSSQDEMYLPISYESFHGKGPLLDRCYVRIDRSLIRTVNDIATIDMDFFNPEGRLVAKLKGLTVKRVKDRDQMDPERVKVEKVEKVERHEGIKTRDHYEGDETNVSCVSSLERALKKIFAKYINIEMDQLENSVGFFELGLESSQLLELVKDIEQSFQLALSPSLLFEYSNFMDLTKYLQKKLGEGGTKPQSFPNTKTGASTISSNRYKFYGSEPFLQDHLMYGRPAIIGLTYPCLAMESYLGNNYGGYPVELNDVRVSGGPIGLNKSENVEIEVKLNEQGTKLGFDVFKHATGESKTETICSGYYERNERERLQRVDIKPIIKKSKVVTTPISVDPRQSCLVETEWKYNNTTSVYHIKMVGSVNTRLQRTKIADYRLLKICYLLCDTDCLGKKISVLEKIEKMTVFKPVADYAYVVKKIRIENPDFIAYDAMVVTEGGDVVAEFINVQMQRVELPVLLKDLISETEGYEEKSARNSSIAIVGVSGRYPGARSLDEFWGNLKAGTDSITEIPEERWDWKEYFNDEKGKEGKIYSKWGGFISGADEFDPLFFNISPKEAESMDPQERLFLECAYHTLEDAGYTRERLNNQTKDRLGARVGVFAGVMYEEYQLYGAQDQKVGKNTALVGSPASIANRVSYSFNFHGPSMAVDSMCSSSLTALHLACLCIERGECDAAIAGGVNLSIHPNKYLVLSKGNFLSSQGRCESFGKGGDGYIPGEGVGAVLLKPLCKAEEDGDQIYGIIRGSMINSGGKTSGYTVPNPAAQGEVIREAIERAGVDARDISYIEAHGTGTSLGDPIEIAGLTRAFNQYTEETQFCAIGSVKSNIGHCESAAGISGLTKVLLQMKHKQLVPSIHAAELNPNIEFGSTPFKVQRELADWNSETPRIAGISSFGAGGANAHVVIEEYVAEKKDPLTPSREHPALIVVSAKNDERLKERVDDLLEWLAASGHGDEKLPDIAYTLQVGREGMEERLGFTAGTIQELKVKLNDYLKGGTDSTDIYRGQVKRNKEASSRSAMEEELQKAVRNWNSEMNHEKLLDAWVNGLTIDWDMIYVKEKPGKISLPVYPFARDKYWVAGMKWTKFERSHSVSQIHPLLHENISDLAEEFRWSST